MATDSDLRTYVLADGTVSGITTSYFQNTVPEAADVPFIWCRRQRIERDETIGEARRTLAIWYDIECVSSDLDEAISLADAVRDRLEGTSGTMGSGTYAWVTVEDQFDDYVPRNEAADESLHVISLIVQVYLP
jgi:hypothetical protein